MIYIPAHLYHICFELLKNSIRATIERHGADAREFPAIRVHVVKGHEDVSIVISDRGGLFAFASTQRSKSSAIFTFSLSLRRRSAYETLATVSLHIFDSAETAVGSLR